MCCQHTTTPFRSPQLPQTLCALPCPHPMLVGSALSVAGASDCTRRRRSSTCHTHDHPLGSTAAGGDFTWILRFGASFVAPRCYHLLVAAAGHAGEDDGARCGNRRASGLASRCECCVAGDGHHHPGCRFVLHMWHRSGLHGVGDWWHWIGLHGELTGLVDGKRKFT